MSDFPQELCQRLEHLRAQGLYRELRPVASPQQPVLRVQGRDLLNFSSNDYLGLANDPRLKEAACRAVEQFGAGSGASRLICGSLEPHHRLEEVAADFKGTAAALSFSSGYAAVVGTICALLDKEDVIVLDKLVHASIVDAARLCGAKIRVFAHNDLNDLQAILQWADQRGPARAPATTAKTPRTLIVTESVFSMDGDCAPLKEMVVLKERHGAWLMLDEAHATGLYGPRRRGLAEAEGVSDRIEIQLATLGKAVGASGGCVCGPRPLVDYLVNRARSLIFSTAPAPAAAAAATAGLQFIQSPAGAERCRLLWERVEQCVGDLPLPRPAPGAYPSAILPIAIGAEERAVAAATALRQEGVFIPAIRYPTVARGQARLRLTVTAAHRPQDIARLAEALAAVGLNQPPASSL